MSTVEAVLIGAGQRGADSYAPYALAHPERLRFTALVEPDAERRRRFAEAHRLPSARCFADWDALFAEGRLADAAFVCTPDRQHVAPALRALELGYHVLLEKPFATAPEDCVALVQAAQRAQRRLDVCHVARHTAHFKRLRELVQSGALGEVIHVDHSENVSYWHMAHSYVRGNWRRSDQSAPMLLAKCCHDLDLLGWWLREPVARVASHGGLKHFRPENAPPGAPQRCTDGCPAAAACPFYAPRFYGALGPLFESAAHGGKLPQRLAFELGGALSQLFYDASRRVPLLRKLPTYDGWPRSVLDAEPTPEHVLRALETGPYGRCVYHSDNDVVDHQVVQLALSSGTSVTLRMHGHAAIEGRHTHIHGARASLSARIGIASSEIELVSHTGGAKQHFDTTSPRLDGHGGGDFGLVAAFVDALRRGDHDEHGEEALESHLLAFAAEEARATGTWVDMPAFRARHGAPTPHWR